MAVMQEEKEALLASTGRLNSWKNLCRYLTIKEGRLHSLKEFGQDLKVESDWVHRTRCIGSSASLPQQKCVKITKHKRTYWV